jgi:hypothetical protein
LFYVSFNASFKGSIKDILFKAAIPDKGATIQSRREQKDAAITTELERGQL